MIFIEHKSKNIKGAYLYAPEKKSTSLVIWLSGGYGQTPQSDSLGKLISDKVVVPSCLVLIPCASYGHNLKNITSEELWKLVDIVKESYNIKTVSIVGWSNGSDAAAQQVAATPDKFYRICLISNYTKQWDKCAKEINSPVYILLGAKEKSAAKNRSWPIVDQLKNCILYRVDPYDHMIGEKIWTDGRYYLLEWLSNQTDDILTPPRELIKASKKVVFNENIETKRRIFKDE